MHVNPKPKPPLPGGEHTFVVDTGPQAVPPGTPRVNLIPVGDGGPGPSLPRRKTRKPALPTPEEVEALPNGARAALALRCARRVAPLVQLGGEGAVAATVRAATAILRVAADAREVRAIRRDFERVRRLAKVHGWADDTPVPMDVFGPMWPEGCVPEWAKGASELRS